MFTKGWPQQKRILKIKWIGWPVLQIPSLRISASFPSHSCHHPLGSWTNYPWWQRWRPCIGSATWTSTHQGHTGYGYHWVPNLPAVETNTESLIWNDSLWWSASYLVAGWLHWTASIMEGAAFCSYWNRHSGYRFAFPACDASTKTISCGLTEYLIYHNGTPNSTAFD